MALGGCLFGGVLGFASVQAKVVVNYRLEQQANPPRAPIRPRSFLRPEMVSPRLDVPRHIPRPPYVGAAEPPLMAEEIQIQDEAGVAGMRAAGRLAALIRDFVGSLVRVRYSFG